jgi:hypothetical protein
MQALARCPETDTETGIELPPAGHQWLPVSARVVERYLVTFRAPAAKLVALVPAPMSLDVYRGQGFVSVCALELARMGIAGTPSWLRFDNREFLYRIGVRFRGEPTFLTLRSDVSARPLAWLGRRFSHYRPHLGSFTLDRAGGFHLACRSLDGLGDARLELEPDGGSMAGSLFPDAGSAARFLLGMRFSADARGGKVRVQPIEHEPWGARPARVRGWRFAFLEALEKQVGALTLDHCLGMRDLRQTWRAARWT